MNDDKTERHWNAKIENIADKMPGIITQTVLFSDLEISSYFS